MRTHRVSALFFFAIAAAMPAFAAEGTHFDGRVFERGTHKPLEGVNVFCIPEVSGPDGEPKALPAIKATTNAEGRFSIDGVPNGVFKWVVNLTGYDRLEKYDESVQGMPQPIPPRELFLEKSTYFTYETTIYDKAQKRDDKTRSITREQFSKLAGSGGDPIKAVQSLPGVNRSSGFSSMVIIEGSNPQDTLYQIDGHEVPLIFHFGGFTTVVPPESVDRVDLMTSGFGAEYGRTTAGLVGVWIKEPLSDRLHGMGFVDLFNVGGIVEGPIGDQSSFLFSVRKSYIGLVLSAVAKNNADFNLTVAPEFQDVTGIYQTQLTPIDKFRLVTVGSLDTLSFVLSQPVKSNPSLRGNFSTLTAFYRVIPQLTHRHSPRTTSRLSFGFGRDWIRFDTSDNYFRLIADNLTLRGEVERKMNDYWKTFFGVDSTFAWATVEFLLPRVYASGGVLTPFGTSASLAARVQPTYNEWGGYWRNEVRLGDSPWTLVPALRVDYYGVTQETLPAPRLQIRDKISDSLTLRAAGGYYTMPPLPEQIDSTYGNAAIKSSNAWHATMGAEADLRGGTTRGWSVTSDLFYKQFSSMVVPSAALVTQADGKLTPENYNNSGKARAFGVESQIRYDFSPWSGWISYTLSRATRWDSVSAEALSQFDQTHVVTATGSWELPRNWQLSARFRYVTGNPYTPVLGGTLDADNDVYVPTRGRYFSERVGSFSQLDLRLDKKWIYDRWILTFYIDIQNVLNHSNSEAIRYSYDYSKTTNIEGLPFLPILGLKGEF